ncbi:hypothetical protein BC835DRAFT_1103261 [Cytidiella melzeri]|nr:hypothetical protein BC835DRAFT_1103261 [Cytidiella melzeri]
MRILFFLYKLYMTHTVHYNVMRSPLPLEVTYTTATSGMEIRLYKRWPARPRYCHPMLRTSQTAASDDTWRAKLKQGRKTRRRKSAAVDSNSTNTSKTHLHTHSPFLKDPMQKKKNHIAIPTRGTSISGQGDETRGRTRAVSLVRSRNQQNCRIQGLPFTAQRRGEKKRPSCSMRLFEYCEQGFP